LGSRFSSLYAGIMTERYISFDIVPVYQKKTENKMALRFFVKNLNARIAEKAIAKDYMCAFQMLEPLKSAHRETCRNKGYVPMCAYILIGV